jgi:CysZ protein
VRALKVSLISLAVGLPLVAGLTVVGLLVPAAAVVTLPLKFVVSAILVAWDLLDYPLGRRGLGVGARLRWFGAHMGAVLGFGSFAAVVLFIPCAGLLLLPVGVAGATALVVRAERAI